MNPDSIEELLEAIGRPRPKAGELPVEMEEGTDGVWRQAGRGGTPGRGPGVFRKIAGLLFGRTRYN